MIEHPAELDNLTKFVDEARRAALAAGLSATEVTRIELCVEEVAVNIINYAYQKSGGVLRMSCSNDKFNLTITIEDDGVPFDMLQKEDPDIDAPAEDRPIGGLGVFLVKELMDEVVYTRENKKNVLVLKKNLTTTD
jgi:sigma-B regulation protein RsbU (phosphoserine phosphatase)